MKKFFISLNLAALFALPTQADVLMGHNLTPTSNHVARQQIMAGTYAITYGITDEISVGTSPWLIWQYNMPVLGAKYSFEMEGYLQRITVEQLYLKTFKYAQDLYQQESTWTRITATHRYDALYTLHANFGIQYFIDDTVAFSMRPMPLNQTPLTLSLTTLHEFNITESFGAFVEGGFLAFNYPNRYVHTGVSGFYKWTSGYIQLGISKTMPIGSDRMDPSSLTAHKNSNNQWRTGIYGVTEAPIHPEVQVQFLL